VDRHIADRQILVVAEQQDVAAAACR
jgi:hypothetical protein